jgi:chromosome segregation ATPase
VRELNPGERLVRNKLAGGRIVVDEVNQEDMLEYQSGGTDSVETEEPQDDAGQSVGADGMEALLAQKDEELAGANARIAELEEALLGRDVDIAALEQSISGLEERLAAANNALVEAVNSYRDMIVRANPDIVEELISGDTIESLNESLEKARSLIGRVRQGLETEIALTRVPAGAPERRPPDLSALSPREKIQYAIGGKR